MRLNKGFKPDSHADGDTAHRARYRHADHNAAGFHAHRATGFIGGNASRAVID